MAVDQHHTTSLTPEELRRTFAEGASAEEFKASLPGGGARLTELESLVEADRSASAFARLDRQLNVLAIVDGWCRDSRETARRCCCAWPAAGRTSGWPASSAASTPS